MNKVRRKYDDFLKVLNVREFPSVNLQYSLTDTCRTLKNSMSQRPTYTS